MSVQYKKPIQKLFKPWFFFYEFNEIPKHPCSNFIEIEKFGFIDNLKGFQGFENIEQKVLSLHFSYFMKPCKDFSFSTQKPYI